MATKAYYPIEEIGKGKPGFSKTRSITVSYTHLDVYKRQAEWRLGSAGTGILPVPLHTVLHLRRM